MSSGTTEIQDEARQDAPRTADVASLRRRGTHGGIIEPHRSIATVRFSRRDFAIALLLTIGFTWVVVAGIARITELWTWVFARLAGPLGFSEGVLSRAIHVGFLAFNVPAFAADAAPPSRPLWWITLIVTVVAVLASMLIRRNLPLAYSIRLMAVTQATALVYFWFWPTSFPYPLASYVSSMLVAAATVVMLVPIVLGFTYFVIDVGILQKIGLTVLMLVHLIVFIPLQYAVHSYLIHRGSQLFLPPLFMLFGLLPEVMIFIALYGWGMSWNARGARQSRE